MTQTLFGTIAAFMYLLRYPSAAALFVAMGVFLNLPYILPAYHGLDFVLAALLALAAGILLCASYLGTLTIIAPREYAAVVSVWLASTLVSVAFSDRPDISYQAFRTVVPYIVLTMMLIALIANRKAMMLIFTGMIFATAGLSVLSLLQWGLDLGQVAFGGLALGEVSHIYGEVNEVRPGGPMEDANFFAAYLLPGTLLAVGRFFRASSIPVATLYALASVISVSGILLTASRGALGALFVGLVLLFLVERKIWPWIASVVLAVALVSVFPPAYVERITGTIGLATTSLEVSAGPAEDEAIAGRLGSMQAAAEMFLRHPVAGVGYGQYEANFQAFVAQHDLKMRNQDRGAHTLYLEIAAETGLIGLAAFGLLLLLGGHNLHRLARRLRAIGDKPAYLDVRNYAVAIAGFLAAHMFLHDAKAHYIWLFFGLMFISPLAATVSGSTTQRGTNRK